MVNFIARHMLCVNRGSTVGNQECGEMCSGTKSMLPDSPRSVWRVRTLSKHLRHYFVDYSIGSGGFCVSQKNDITV